MWGSCCNIPKAIFYLLQRDYRVQVSVQVGMVCPTWRFLKGWNVGLNYGRRCFLHVMHGNLFAYTRNASENPVQPTRLVSHPNPKHVCGSGKRAQASGFSDFRACGPLKLLGLEHFGKGIIHTLRFDVPGVAGDQGFGLGLRSLAGAGAHQGTPETP